MLIREDDTTVIPKGVPFVCLAPLKKLLWMKIPIPPLLEINKQMGRAAEMGKKGIKKR